MTHDELLAKIENNGTLETELICTCPHKEVKEIKTRPHRNDLALRAVVEILKSYNDGVQRVNPEFNQGVLALSNIIKDAIEKELA
jgi:hypothetical protein